MLEPHFDRWAFDGRKVRPVSAQTHIDWRDFQNEMHTSGPTGGAGKRRWTPIFAYSDEQVRRVLLHCGARYLHGGLLPASGPLINHNWQEVDRACTVKALNENTKGVSKHQAAIKEQLKRAVRKTGSYLAVDAGIVLHFWRRGLDSVAVAQITGMTPLQVRQRAYKLVQIARGLGLETFAPHHSFGTHRAA